MLITFRSSAAANVIMMAEHALPLMHVAGKSYGDKIPSQGVFTVEQLDQAVTGLNRVVQGKQASSADEADIPLSDLTVHLAQRAVPLLDMMRKSKEASTPVLWEASSGY